MHYFWILSYLVRFMRDLRLVYISQKKKLSNIKHIFYNIGTKCR